MRNSFVKYAMALALLSVATLAKADISLSFASLPSAQGWSYTNQGTNASEQQVFQIDNGTLVQNTIGVVSYASGSNRYNLFDQLVAGQSYAMTFTAKLTAEQISSNPNNRWAFGAGYFDGQGGEFGVGLGRGVVQTDWAIYNLDTSTIHTYKLVGTSANGSNGPVGQLWVDGVFFGSGAGSNYGSCMPSLGALCNSVYIGDGTSGPNASGVYYALSMAPVPEPETYAMLLAGLGLMGGIARRKQKQ